MSLRQSRGDSYLKYDASGNFLKNGISKDGDTRYSAKILNGGRVDVIDNKPRDEAVKIERVMTETNPGPENKETWAGKKNPDHPNYDPNYISPYEDYVLPNQTKK